MKRLLGIMFAAATCVSTASAAWEEELAGSTHIGDVVINADNTMTLVDGTGQTVEGFSYNLKGGQWRSGSVHVWENTTSNSNSDYNALILDLSDVGKLGLDNFAISFTASEMSAPTGTGDSMTHWGNLLAVGESSNKYVPIYAEQGVSSLSSKVTGYGNNVQRSELVATAVKDISQQHDYLLKFELASGDAHLVSLFQDGSLVYQAEYGKEASIGQGGPVVYLGGNPQQWDAQTGGTFSNIKIYALPEPTTATLSLLALAGLASRRRRK